MGKFHRRTIVRACLGHIIMLGSSCGKDGGAPASKFAPVKIAALFASRRDPFHNTQALMLQQLAQTRAGTEVLAWDAAGDAALQSNQLVTALASKPDFLLVFPVDAQSLSPALERVVDGPRMFVLADLPLPGPRASVIFSSDSEVGRAAGDFVVRSLKHKVAEQGLTEPSGRVIELTAGADSAISGSFSRVISQHPGVVLVHQGPCGIIGEETAERVSEALRLQKDFDVIFAHNDLIARAASRAVEVAQAGLRERILIIGIDGTLGKGGGNEMILNGEIDATISRPLLVDFVWALINRCLADPQFAPKARYELKPSAIGMDAALDAAKNGRPVPSVD